MPAEGVLSTLHKLTTALDRLDKLAEDFREMRVALIARIERLENQSADLRERIARIEAGRDADLAKLQAEASRFKAEIERAELRLTQQLPKSRGRSRQSPD
jgi:predicted nuclease with TOPRIM domain